MKFSYFIVILILIPILHFSMDVLAHSSGSAKLDKLSEHIMLAPNNAGNYIKRGLLYESLGHNDLALTDLMRAEELGVKDKILLPKARILFRQGQLLDALALLNQLMIIVPENRAGLLLRAQVYTKLLDFKSAIDDYRTLISIEAQPTPGIYLALADSLLKLNQNNKNEVLQLLDDGIKKNSGLIQLQNRAVDLCVEWRWYDEAIARMKTLGEVLNHSSQWQVALADLYLKKGDHEQAKFYYKNSLDTLNAERKTPKRDSREKYATKQLDRLKGEPLSDG